MSVILRFFGAARTVTGSCYLLETGSGRILIDCGLFQGPKTLKQLNYRAFPFRPADIHAVLLTHAHIDHSGMLPKLAREGFAGAILATRGTIDLCSWMLPDAGGIQEAEVAALNRRNAARGRTEVSPIYTQADALASLRQFRPVEYEHWVDVMPGVRARYWNAGHLLGSSSIEVECTDRTSTPGRPLRLLFSGDIGPEAKLLQPDPKAPAGFDYVVAESTYGDRTRPPTTARQRRDHLAAEVREAAAAKGPLLIPAFAVERTQELIVDLVDLMERGEVPAAPIFLDSPLAIHATEVFREHAASLDSDIDVNRLFSSPHLRFTETVDESKSIAKLTGFHVVIAASGMCEAGRIRHHLKRWLWNSRATVLLVGYQAQGTLGRFLQDGVAAVRIQGEEIKVGARIRMIDEYSGHADGAELAQWIAARRPVERGLFLAHGEEAAIAGLAARISGRIIPAARIFQPLLDDGYELAAAAPRQLDGEQRRRLAPEAVTHLDWHNDMSRLILDINDHIEAAADDRARNVIIRRLRRALDEAGQILPAGRRALLQRLRMHIRLPPPGEACALPDSGFLFQLPRQAGSLHRPDQGRTTVMKLGAAIAEIMKREGIEILCGYPVNHLIEFAANADIRPVMVRQERIGIHMADAISRVTSGRSIGAFCMQHGPGAENAMGGVAQCYGESVPVLVLPMGYARRLANIDPNFNSSQAMRAFAKSSEPINLASEVCNIFRRAFTKLKNGRGGPVIVEIPADMWNEEVAEPLNYTPVLRTRYAADPLHVKEAAAMLVGARRPVIYAGQGVHYAKAWPQLRRLAERLAIPVTTSLGGKSSFPETHPLSLGSGGLAVPRAVPKFLAEADVIFGIGCSFTETSFGIAMPKGKTVIHSTLDPNHLNKDVEAKIGLVGDAGLVLDALLEEIGKTVTADRDASAVAAEIAASHKEWLAKWLPKLTSNDAPLNPYRVLWDLQHTVDIANTIITHDAGSPRDQLSPFWKPVEPLSYIGWGKTTQLGYGLGLAMGAKLAKPDKLCINVWGDAAIGFTGMDFETAVRERIPIMSILLNNFSMAIELKVMPISTEKYRSTDISGDYAAMARAFGGYGERVTRPEDIIPAIKRGIEKTREGVPVLLEFITSKETEVSRPGT